MPKLCGVASVTMELPDIDQHITTADLYVEPNVAERWTVSVFANILLLAVNVCLLDKCHL